MLSYPEPTYVLERDRVSIEQYIVQKDKINYFNLVSDNNYQQVDTLNLS